jgi:uncharacterized protein
MPFELILLLGAAFIVGMSKGGLASAGTLAVPILAIWIEPLKAAALLLPIYIVSDVFGVWLYRHEYSVRNLQILIPAGLAGVGIATLIAPVVEPAVFTVATGLIGLWYCATEWFMRDRPVKTSQANLVPGAIWGFVAGITSFVSHSGAPPFQAFVLPQRLPKLIFAGTTTITFAAVNLAKLPAYISIGLLKDFDLESTLVLSISAIVGTFAGRALSQRLSDHLYRRVIKIILFILSLQLLWQGSWKLVQAVSA